MPLVPNLKLDESNSCCEVHFPEARPSFFMYDKRDETYILIMYYHDMLIRLDAPRPMMSQIIRYWKTHEKK